MTTKAVGAAAVSKGSEKQRPVKTNVQTTTTSTTATKRAEPAPTPRAIAATAAATETTHGIRRAAAGGGGGGGSGALDALSDKVTILLIRRTLCPKETTGGGGPGGTTATATVAAQPLSLSSPSPSAASAAQQPAAIEALLPPLTSRNDVDRQLYALLAIAVREFVLTWYAKISPDEQFVTELVQIVAHCTRALEQRLRKVDLESLVFDELPELLDNHVKAFRASHQSLLVRPPVQTDPRAVYHALCPLPALSPVPPIVVGGNDKNVGKDDGNAAAVAAQQAANEAAYRHLLVRGLLAVLLPTEDLQNECLTSLVGQIVAELLIGGVLARRVAEPWMMWEVIGMVARLVREKMDGAGSTSHRRLHQKPQRPAKPTKTKPSGPSSVPSSESPSESLSTPSSPPFWLAAVTSSAFWSLLRLGFAVWALLRFFVLSIALSRSLPRRIPQLPSDDQAKAAPITTSATAAAPSTDTATDDLPIPVVAFRLWPMLANLAQLNLRMPWLTGAFSLAQWLAMTGPARLGALDGPLDRLLSHYLHKHALDPALLPGLLRSLRAAVFPGNKFGAVPPTLVPPATAAEEAALRRRTALAVVDLLPFVRDDDSATRDALAREVEGSVLDVFSDAYCNKHLLYGVLEAILVRLAPELAETGVLDLWEERLA